MARDFPCVPVVRKTADRRGAVRNISFGGTLRRFWRGRKVTLGTLRMMTMFGWKAAMAVIINAAVARVRSTRYRNSEERRIDGGHPLPIEVSDAGRFTAR
jgi:hypothetical protein